MTEPPQYTRPPEGRAPVRHFPYRRSPREWVDVERLMLSVPYSGGDGTDLLHRSLAGWAERARLGHPAEPVGDWRLSRADNHEGYLLRSDSPDGPSYHLAYFSDGLMSLFCVSPDEAAWHELVGPAGAGDWTRYATTAMDAHEFWADATIWGATPPSCMKLWPFPEDHAIYDCRWDAVFVPRGRGAEPLCLVVGWLPGEDEPLAVWSGGRWTARPPQG